MSKKVITIVGGGQSGLQLGNGLLSAGYDVRLVQDRKGDDIRAGKVMSSQCMFDIALSYERELGLNFWDKECPTVDSINFTVPAPDGSGNKAIDWNGMLDKPAQAVDQRIKFPRWMQEFEKRGGTIEYKAASPEDLEKYAAQSDLVIVAAGKGDIARLFERDAQKSQFDAPQRALALTYVKGLTPWPHHSAVAFNLIPGVGEYFVFPALTTTGPCEIMVFEGVPGGPMDCWGDVSSPEQHLAKSKWILDTFLPWEAARAKTCQLTDANGILVGRFAPTVRKPIARRQSGVWHGRRGRAQRPDHGARIEQCFEVRKNLSRLHPCTGRQTARPSVDAGDVRSVLGLRAVRDRMDQRAAAAAAPARPQYHGRRARFPGFGQAHRQRLQRAAGLFPVVRGAGRS
jgi:hypothetical protein